LAIAPFAPIGPGLGDLNSRHSTSIQF